MNNYTEVLLSVANEYEPTTYTKGMYVVGFPTSRFMFEVVDGVARFKMSVSFCTDHDIRHSWKNGVDEKFNKLSTGRSDGISSVEIAEHNIRGGKFVDLTISATYSSKETDSAKLIESLFYDVVPIMFDIIELGFSEYVVNEFFEVE